MNTDKETAIKRREETIKKLDALAVDYCKGLPLTGNYKLCKSENQICKRFIASLFFSMLACDYMQDRHYYETEGKEITEQAVDEFRLKNYYYCPLNFFSSG